MSLFPFILALCAIVLAAGTTASELGFNSYAEQNVTDEANSPHTRVKRVTCFDADSTVLTSKGKMDMADLYKVTQTEPVEVATADGHFSPFTFWIHAEPHKTAEFIRLTTASGQSISLTGGHLIFTTSCNQTNRRTIRAENIALGDCLLVETDGILQAQQVVKVEKFKSVGFYSPMTAREDLLVDNILVSCYGEVEAVMLQSLMLKYVNIVKSAAQKLFADSIVSAIFGGFGSETPIPEVIEQFLSISGVFVA